MFVSHERFRGFRWLFVINHWGALKFSHEFNNFFFSAAISFFFADYLNFQIRNQTARMLRAAARSAAWAAAISIVIYNICPIFKASTVHSFPEEEEKPTGKQMERQLEGLPSEGRLGGGIDCA